MATIPADRLIKHRHSASKDLTTTYTKVQFNAALQAAVDELLKASTANGLDNKMDAANPGFTFNADTKKRLRALAHEEAERQT